MQGLGVSAGEGKSSGSGTEKVPFCLPKALCVFIPQKQKKKKKKVEEEGEI